MYKVLQGIALADDNIPLLVVVCFSLVSQSGDLADLRAVGVQPSSAAFPVASVSSRSGLHYHGNMTLAAVWPNCLDPAEKGSLGSIRSCSLIVSPGSEQQCLLQLHDYAPSSPPR
jgi:hypothetical protein